MIDPTTSSTPETVPPAAVPPMPAKTGFRRVFFASLAIVVLLILGVFAWTILRGRTATAPAQPPANAADPVPTVSDGTDMTSSTLRVDWHLGQITEPGTAFPGVITSASVEVALTIGEGGLEGLITPETVTSTYEYAFYDHGVVADGPYRGQKVFSAILLTELGREIEVSHLPIPSRLTLLTDGQGTVRIVGLGTNDLFRAWHGRVIFAPNLRIALSAFPNQLTLDNGKIVKQQNGNGLSGAFQPQCDSRHCLDRLPAARTTDGLALFVAPLTGQFMGRFGTGTGGDPTQPGCLVYYREDGSAAIYESTIAANRKTSTETLLPAPEIGDDELAWDAAYANTSTYRTHMIGGCGGWSCPEIMTDEQMRNADILPEDLAEAGRTAAGDPLYVFRSPMNPRSPGEYFLPLRQAYDNWWFIDPATQEKPTFGDFLRRQTIPLFFWKDALGRWTVYKNTASVPLAECGKPVIYLYPSKPTDVRVRLPSTINVTVSEPAYPADGWLVNAKPDGELTLKSDGSSWTSLFWEGTGVSYPVPQTGFVVKQADIQDFLKKTLAAYGLNEKEAREFEDFWVPLMTGAPYYRIAFLTDDWTRRVPLAVSPAPATQIRLFMDWQKLASPISLPEPKITTPARTGFTLVEWGGLLRN